MLSFFYKNVPRETYGYTICLYAGFCFTVCFANYGICDVVEIFVNIIVPRETIFRKYGVVVLIGEYLKFKYNIIINGC